jgi:Leucine-rich repeat (LRR) protein
VFPNLECLWLNQNRLEKIENLDSNFRIKYLYVQNNQIKTLDGSLKYFKHLDTLAINENELRGLDHVLAFLKQFPLLVSLDLFGNPLAEEPNYRFKVLNALPQLTLFDRQSKTI